MVSPRPEANAGFLGREKRFEEVGQGFFGQPRTLVAHTQPGLTRRRFRSRFDARRRLAVHRVERVADQVDQHLFQPVDVA
jgi:hypothetical protein